MAAQGKYDEAVLLFKRALAIDEKALGAEHPQVAARLNDLGMKLTGKFIIDLTFLCQTCVLGSIRLFVIDLVFLFRHAFSGQYVCLLLAWQSLSLWMTTFHTYVLL